MTLSLACGDVMPGCTASFENTDQQVMLDEMAAHAASAHGLKEITQDILEVVQSKIVYAR